VKTLSVTLEIERRLILRVVRILPIRVRTKDSGRVDLRAAKERMVAAMGDYINPQTDERAIARLQRDASYFWVPSEAHWLALSRLLGLPVDELKRAADAA